MRRLILPVATFLLVSPCLPTVATVDAEGVPDNWSPKVNLSAIDAVEALPFVSRGNNLPVRVSNGRVPPAELERCLEDEEGVTRCYADEFSSPPDLEENDVQLTEGQILTAAREIGMPRLTVQIQPREETLVNARTNFYTDPQAFARSITLLDFDINLTATPIQYTWVHGDGTTARTASPGAKYPNLDVTHRYRKPAKRVNTRVDVTYQVRYRVDGGAWTTIGQTLTATGPTTPLQVNEAAPVLTGS